MCYLGVHTIHVYIYLLWIFYKASYQDLLIVCQYQDSELQGQEEAAIHNH